MKKIRIIGLALWMGTTLSAYAGETATAYRVRPAIQLQAPLQLDSVNFNGEKFTLKNLLQTQVDIDFSHPYAYTRMETDTTGYVRVDKAEANGLLYLFSTRLRAEHFTEGVLKISSPVRWEVFVDGQSKWVKDTSEDSLASVRPAEVRLSLEPETDYDIVIKLLSIAEDKETPALKCEFEPDNGYKDAVVHMNPDMKRRFSLYNTAFGSKVYSVALSPDGKYLLTYYWDNYSTKRSRTWQELTEVKSQRVVHPNVPTNARWMPVSNRLYYTVKGSRSNDLVFFDPETMREEVVMENLPEGNFVWSPTEEFLIYTEREEGKEPDGPLKRIQMPDDRIPGWRNRTYLVKYDLKTGLSQRLTYGSESIYLNDISPDASKLLCTSSKSHITECPYSLVSLFEIDLGTMKADTLVSADPYLNQAAYSPDGKQLVILGGPDALGGIGKNYAPHPVGNQFDVQAFLMDLGTRKFTSITRDFNPSVSLLQWNRADNCIYFSTVDKDCQHIYRYVPDKGAFEMLPLKEDVITSFTIADDNPVVAAYVGGGNTSAGAAYLYHVRKQTSELLANPMKETLDEINFGQMQEWDFTASDGTIIEGMMCLPPDFNPGKKYPLIVYYYGGTTPTTRGMTSPYCAQLFAARDYVVYIVQPSGTIGYGQEFSARHVNAWGDYTADNIIEGTKKFCEAHPFVNSERIGCLGASYGGFMTMYLQTKTDMFAAAVSHAGISNVTSYWGEGYWGYSYNAVAAANSYPWTRPELFTKHGALFNADKIHTPLLLLHGTVDTNVPIGESIQLYNALKILGRPVEFITVEGENHFIADYDKRVLWHNSIMAWFAKWLQDRPEWWDNLYK